MRGEEGNERWRIAGRLLAAPVVFVMVMLYCVLITAFYAFVVWPITGATVVYLKWEEADATTRRRVFTPTRD